MRTPVISLGAGVQSTTLALMAAAGEFEAVPELAIFADTGWEPQAVYGHLDWLEEELRGTIEVARVQLGDLLEDATAGFNPIPLFSRGADGRLSMGQRQCTNNYKLRPIYAEMRRRGLSAVDLWLGISTDEIQRMKPARVEWVRNRWPLIDKRVSRADCLSWLEEHGFPRPPRSACVFCPYHGPRKFARMRDEEPEEFARAVAADEAMRQGEGRELFVLKTLEPLADVKTLEDEGQLTIGFDEECEGVCGV